MKWKELKELWQKEKTYAKEALSFERNSPEQNAIIRRYINECNSEAFIQQFFHQEELI